jgi:hypothetical protein
VLAAKLGDSIVWRDAPTPTQIAQFCPRLDTVTTSVIAPHLPAWRRITVQAFLDMTPRERARLFAEGLVHTPEPQEHGAVRTPAELAAEALSRAMAFADEFNRARRSMTGER